jgi:hypothetical protein
LLASIPAIVVAVLALRKISRSDGRLGGKGSAIAGLVLGCVGMLVLPGLYIGLPHVLESMDLGDYPDAQRPSRQAKSKDGDPGPLAELGGQKVNVGQNIWLEVAGKKRRVLVAAEVCLRKGQLEQFMTRKGKKEHEAIVAADIDARKLHETLILAGAKEGSPVQFFPRVRPPTGSKVEVSVVYTDAGEKKVVSARSWIRNLKTGKELDTDWVFAGSQLVANPFDEKAPKEYLANQGDVICVSNFVEALLDLPILSSKDDADRSFEAWTERIPKIDTKVIVVLQPVLGKRK